MAMNNNRPMNLTYEYTIFILVLTNFKLFHNLVCIGTKKIFGF